MPERVRAWTAPESLADLTLFSDWDSVASMIASLRIHLFEHGTVPVWNFSFCGGRPELAVPFSWAYTWPSLFAYAFEPNAAILAVWAALTTVGVLSLAALLRRWTGSPLAAATGACLYAFNGYFAVTFVAGHVSFAFFHLVPLLMLLFERSFAAACRGHSPLGTCALATLAAFALFSGGLPHALFHFYPALAALILLRVAQAAHRSGCAFALRAATAPCVAHVLGLWLAVYKLWPVMRWQTEFPRGGIYPESRSLLAILDGAVGLVPGFLRTDLLGVRDPFRLGGNAYLGPLPWLLAAVAVVALARRRRSPSGEPGARAPDHLLTAFALALVLAGLALALGNANPWSPAVWFAHVPFLAGVRGFGRYEILSIFGVALLAAQALACLRRLRLPLAFLAVGPILVQAGLLAWRIPALPNAAIVSRYDVEPHPEPPEFIGVPVGTTRHRTALLEQGYWIANCYENLTLPAPPVTAAVGARIPLSTPPPARLEALGRDRLGLGFDPAYRGWIHLHLPVLESFEYDATPGWLRHGRVRFRASELADHRLTIHARYAGPRDGFIASGLGCVATALFYGGWILRLRRAMGPTH